MHALVAVDRRAGAGLALQMEDLGAVRERVDHGLGLGLAALDVVGADMGKNAFDAVDAAVDGDDRHAGLHGLLDRWRERVDVERRDDDGVDLLHDGRFDVGRLLGRGILAVALGQVDALRLGLNLDLVEHVDEERKRQAGHRAQNGQLVLGKGARRDDRQRAYCYGRYKKITSIHGLTLLHIGRFAAVSCSSRRRRAERTQRQKFAQGNGRCEFVL